MNNDTIHPVESQWHYSVMTVAGFVAETKEAKGLVRRYTYNHPAGHVITYSVGVSMDYWTDNNSGKTGMWSDLEAYVKNLT